MKQKAVFETFLVINGQAVEVAAHLRRLRQTTDLDVADFLQQAASPLSGYHRLRIDFIPPGSLTQTVTSLARPALFDGEFARTSLVTRQFSGPQLNAGHGPFKLGDRSELDSLEAAAAPATPLMIDGTQQLLETTRQNIFIIEGEAIITPPLDGRILPGTTREAVLELADSLGIAHAEEPISLNRALQADGMFVTNALTGIGWVEQCDDQKWPLIPVVVQKLHAALAARWLPD